METAAANLKSLEGQVAVAEQRLADYQAVQANYQEAVTKAQTAVSQAQAAYQASQKALDQAKSQGQPDVAALTQAVERASQELKTAQTQLAQANQSLAQLQAQSGTDQAQLQAAQTQLAQAQTALTNAQTELANKQAAAQTSAQTLAQTKAAYDQLSQPASKSTINQLYLSKAYVDALKAYNKALSENTSTNAALKDLVDVNTEHFLHPANARPVKDPSVDDKTLLDINNLSSEDKNYLAQYAAALVNQFHQALGTGGVVVNLDAQKLAWEIAENYTVDKWRIRDEHDNNAVNRAAQNYGLYVPGGVKFDTEQSYEIMQSNEGAELLPRQATLATLREAVYKAFKGFLFPGEKWLHADKLSGLGRNGAKGYLGLSFSSRSSMSGVHFIYIPDTKRHILDSSKFDRNNNLPPIDFVNQVNQDPVKQAQAKASYEAAQAAHEAAQAAVTQAQAQVQTAQSQVKTAETALAGLVKDSAGLRQAMANQAAAQTALDRAQAAYNQAQTALKQAQSSSSTPDAAAIQELTRALATATQNLASAKSQLAREQGQLAQAQAQTQASQTQLATQRRQVQAAQASLTQAQQARQALLATDTVTSETAKALTQAQQALNQANYKTQVEKVGLAASRYLLAYQAKYEADLKQRQAQLTTSNQGQSDPDQSRPGTPDAVTPAPQIQKASEQPSPQPPTDKTPVKPVDSVSHLARVHVASQATKRPTQTSRSSANQVLQVNQGGTSTKSASSSRLERQTRADSVVSPAQVSTSLAQAASSPRTVATSYQETEEIQETSSTSTLPRTGDVHQPWALWLSSLLTAGLALNLKKVRKKD